MTIDRAEAATQRHIAVSGASGMLGTALRELLLARGHRVTQLVRGEAKSSEQVVWDPEQRKLDRDALQGVDAFVHLSGESVAEGRWTEERRQKIVASRLESTDFLASTAASLTPKPVAFVCASAVGYYGSRGAEELDESSSPGSDFLAEVCQKWEAATNPASAAGIRTVSLRFGVVLSRKGGALAKLLPIFKLGVGGKIGNGEQYLSWISLRDAIGAAAFAVESDSLSGPVNVTGPDPVTNLVFTKTLGGVLHRPTFLPAPKAAIELAFGEMGRETILASQRALPKKLLAAGYRFEQATLEAALRHELRD